MTSNTAPPPPDAPQSGVLRPERSEVSHVVGELDEHSFRIESSGETARVRAIGMVSGVLATEHRVVSAPVEDGEVRASVDSNRLTTGTKYR